MISSSTSAHTSARLRCMLNKVCPQATVLSLEPMPDNFAQLVENTAGSVITENAALAPESGQITIHNFGPDASACHSIYDLGVTSAKPISVPAISLHDIFDKHNIAHARILKLDCQGAEYDTIPATDHDVLEKIDIIAMEVHASISKTGRVLGAIPEHQKKRRILIKHLLKTHVPIRGNIYRDSIQLWANRNIFSKVGAFSRSFKKAYFDAGTNLISREFKWRRYQIRQMIGRPSTTKTNHDRR